MHSRHIALAVASTLTLMLATVGAASAATTADAAQTATPKANIKTDPAATSCTENCADAGYAWAKANGASDAADCEASNDEFAAGCRKFVLEALPAPPAEAAAQTEGTELPVPTPEPAPDAIAPEAAAPEAVAPEAVSPAAPDAGAPAQ